MSEARVILDFPKENPVITKKELRGIYGIKRNISAFPRGSLIMTKEGLKDICSIKKGDYVFTNKNKFAKVLFKNENISSLVQIKGHGHPEFKTVKTQDIWATNYNNIWDNKKKNFIRKFNKRKWVLAKHMEKMFWSSPINFPLVNFIIPFELNKDFTWFIGAYLYSGFIMYDGTIYFKTNNLKLDGLEQRLNRLGFYFRKKQGFYTEYFIRNKEVSNWLKDTFNLSYGVKNIPFWVYGINSEYRQSLFEGFLWSTGVFKDKKYRVSTRDKYLAISMKLIAQTLGYSVALYVSKSKRKKKHKKRWQIVAEINARSSAVLNNSRLGLVRKVEENKRKHAVYSLNIENNESYLVDGIFVR